MGSVESMLACLQGVTPIEQGDQTFSSIYLSTAERNHKILSVCLENNEPITSSNFDSFSGVPTGDSIVHHFIKGAISYASKSPSVSALSVDDQMKVHRTILERYKGLEPMEEFTTKLHDKYEDLTYSIGIVGGIVIGAGIGAKLMTAEGAVGLFAGGAMGGIVGCIGGLAIAALLANRIVDYYMQDEIQKREQEFQSYVQVNKTISVSVEAK